MNKHLQLKVAEKVDADRQTDRHNKDKTVYSPLLRSHSHSQKVTCIYPWMSEEVLKERFPKNL